MYVGWSKLFNIWFSIYRAGLKGTLRVFVMLQGGDYPRLRHILVFCTCKIVSTFMQCSTSHFFYQWWTGIFDMAVKSLWILFSGPKIIGRGVVPFLGHPWDSCKSEELICCGVSCMLLKRENTVNTVNTLLSFWNLFQFIMKNRILHQEL